MIRIALAVGIAWTLAALLVWAWIRAATRRDDDVPAEDGVQPWDIPPWDYPATLTNGGTATIRWVKAD